MKILLLNQTFWPVAGGAESVMRQQAEWLSAIDGIQVRVVTGIGGERNNHYELRNLDELNPDFPLNLKAKNAIDHGQTDNHYQEFHRLLDQKLAPHYDWADVVVTHGPLTTHFNLSLTRCLWDRAATKPTIAWAHDFTPGNKSYALPNPDHMPWAMMKTHHPEVTYVAVSENRREEMASTYGIDASEILLSPPTPDWMDHLGLNPELLENLTEWNIFQRQLILYYPTRLLQRKMLDFAVMVTEALRKADIDALLIYTGSEDPYHSTGKQYRDYLDYLPSQLKISDHVINLSKTAGNPHHAWRAFFRLADVILNPSQYEGFGLLPIEAAFHRLPCWGSATPSTREQQFHHHTILKSPQDAIQAAEKLLDDPFFISRKNHLLRYHPGRVVRESWLPILRTALDRK